MYFINLFVFTATLNLSLKQWFLLQLQRVIRWNITGNKPVLIQDKLDVLLLFFYFQELQLEEQLVGTSMAPNMGIKCCRV